MFHLYFHRIESVDISHFRFKSTAYFRMLLGRSTFTNSCLILTQLHHQLETLFNIIVTVFVILFISRTHSVILNGFTWSNTKLSRCCNHFRDIVYFTDAFGDCKWFYMVKHKVITLYSPETHFRTRFWDMTQSRFKQKITLVVL